MTAADDGHAGRAVLRAALVTAVDDAIGGRGRLVAVTGEAGIGKTTLAQEAATRAREAGARVVWGACWPGEAIEHAVWHAALTDLGPAGARAAAALRAAALRAEGDDLDPSAAAAARAAASDAVIEVVADAARSGPLVMILDDLHWADDSSVRLLAALQARLASLPLLVVATYRDDEVAAASALAEMAALGDRIELRPLTEAEIATILTTVLGHAPGSSTINDVRFRTGGNPFLVVQVGRLLATGDGSALPAGARDVLQRRLAMLDADVRETLPAAAVLGGSFRADVVAALTGRAPDAVIDAFDRAGSARVVTAGDAPGTWMFVHDLFRIAALSTLGTTELAALHRRAADVLAESGAGAAVVAHHLHAAATGPDEDAAVWSLRAAHEALASMAWESATTHAERALAVAPAAPSADPLRGEAWVALGRARLLAGDTEGAAGAFGSAASVARAAGSVGLLAQAALGFAADLGGFEVRLFDQRQIDLLEEAATWLRTDESPSLRARVLARLSVALSFAAPTERRLVLAEQAVALARSSDDSVVLAGALAAHCDAIAGPDDSARRLAESTEVVDLATRAGDGGAELLGRRLRFVALLELGDVAGAHAEARAFARRAAKVGNPLYSWYVDLWRGAWALARGDFDEVTRAGDAIRDAGSRAGSVNAPMLEAVQRGELVFQLGDRSLAERLYLDLKAMMGELFDSPQAAGNIARIFLLMGRDADARAQLDRFEAAGLEAMPRDAEWLPGLATAVQAAVALHHPFLEALVDAAISYADRFAFEGIGAAVHGSIARFAAMGCLALGRHDEAVELARQAVAANRPLGPLVMAHSERALASALADRDPASDEARELDERATRTFHALGLGHFAATAPVERPTTRKLATRAAGAAAEAVLRRDGDVWHVAFAGRSTIIKHGKGVDDLAVLLARPGVEVHVTELEPLPAEVATALRRSARDAAVDRRAIAEYRARLEELDGEIATAQAHNDPVRAERAQTERDFLVDELAASVGLGGRARAGANEPVERLRKAVTARIRDAIRRIGAVHPDLGRHLTNSVRTGTFCSYQPEQPVVWRCEPGSGARPA